MRSGDFKALTAKIEQAKEREYGKHNAVLYYLDLGMAQHEAGEYAASDHSFDSAQNQMEELYTKSVSRHASRVIVDDTTVDYPGMPYERALSYVFRSLNYIYSGDWGEALVDIRRANQFLEEFGAHRRHQKYKDDAFVEYLGSLLYEDFGEGDDARISLEAAARAYERYKATYGVVFPDFKLDPQKTSTYGEVVFLHYNGIGPHKVKEKLSADRQTLNSAFDGDEVDERLAMVLENMQPGDRVTVAYPKCLTKAPRITSSEINADGASVQTLQVENINAIAEGELENDMPSIIKRGLKRYKLKSWVAFLSSGSRNRGGVDLSANELADTRGWNTLPGEIRMARIQLPPGKHRIIAVFRDASGKAVDRHDFGEVAVSHGHRAYLHYSTLE